MQSRDDQPQRETLTPTVLRLSERRKFLFLAEEFPRSPLSSSLKMNGLRRTFSFRKKSKKRSETADGSKPQQWLDDEAKIKDGCCSFQVKYLGNIEVYESRGMQVCEEAIKALRKKSRKKQSSMSVHLIVDQTIEKVSFCAPDRGHEKGFAYICRDGATRRWMCHAFLAVKESVSLDFTLFYWFNSEYPSGIYTEIPIRISNVAQNLNGLCVFDRYLTIKPVSLSSIAFTKPFLLSPTPMDFVLP
ncbi:unnamed protein product [Echinostoma caproni]|uniref:PID domain-containing protein n=1 Tax=Echinostoma caproni TaxID=27848 RepID=A0A183A118_9TREM|nr:unnamed protein product [Echinostoma caproni]